MLLIDEIIFKLLCLQCKGVELTKYIYMYLIRKASIELYFHSCWLYNRYGLMQKDQWLSIFNFHFTAQNLLQCKLLKNYYKCINFFKFYYYFQALWVKIHKPINKFEEKSNANLRQRFAYFDLNETYYLLNVTWKKLRENLNSVSPCRVSTLHLGTPPSLHIKPHIYRTFTFPLLSSQWIFAL